MKFKKLYSTFVSILFLAVPLASYSFEQITKDAPFVTSSYSSWEKVVHYAEINLPQEGYLLSKSDGFVYVKVDDAYIHALYPMLGLKKEGYVKPPYFRSGEAAGAHISVIYTDENVLPKEINEKFKFKLKDIIIVQPYKTVSYAVLQVESPELENLRKKYGLSPKLHNHEFHITLARKNLKR